MNHAPNLPKILRRTMDAIKNRLPDAIRAGVFCFAGRKHKMHRQFASTLEKLLCAMLARVDLASGIVCRHTGKGRLSRLVGLTIADLVHITGLAKSTVCAGLAYLKSIGLLLSEQQRTASIQTRAGFSLACGSCHRRLSPAFWRLMGLEDDFLAEAGKHAPNDIDHVFTRVATDGALKGRVLAVPSRDQAQTQPATQGHAVRESLQDVIARCAAARLAAQSK